MLGDRGPTGRGRPGGRATPEGSRPEGQGEELGGLGQANVDRLEALRTLLKVELDRLTLFERAESVHLDGGVVHKNIGPAIRL